MKILSAYVRQLLVRLILLGIFVMMGTPVFSNGLNADSDTDAKLGLELSSSSSPKRYQPTYSFWNQYAGALYLSAGYSAEFNYDGKIGGKVALDYMLLEELSVGIHLADYYTDSDKETYHSSYVGMRISYHLLRAKLRRGQNPWNVYAGISGELAVGPGNRDWHEKNLLADLHLGVRYRLSERWFLWGEATLNNASVGLSFAL